MSRAIVVSVSIGTGLFIVCMVIMLCLAIGATVCLQGTEPVKVPTVFRPMSGSIGEVERSFNDQNYGPVNLDAAKEVKNGLFARIRENRQLRACSTPQQQVRVPVQQVCAPIQRRAIESSDGTYSYSTVQSTPLVVPSTGIPKPLPFVEMPNVVPTPMVEYPKLNPIETEKPDCPRCRVPLEIDKLMRTRASTRSEKKTGSFICSHCKKPHVGEEWHTDWAEDGTPITFLCESCYSRMTPQQRVAVYQSYATRQTSKIGRNALLHQEIGE